MNNLILTVLGATATQGLALIFYTAAFFLLWRSLSLRLQHVTEIDSPANNVLTTRYALSATAVGLLFQIAVTSENLIQSEPTTSLTLSLLGVSNLVACVMVAVIALSALRVRAENLLLLCLPLPLQTCLRWPYCRRAAFSQYVGQRANRSHSAVDQRLRSTDDRRAAVHPDRRTGTPAARTPNGVIGYVAAHGEHGESVYLRALVRAGPSHAVHCDWHVLSTRHV